MLAGDIGGTKTYIGLFSSVSGRFEAIKIERFSNRDFRGVEEVISSFLSGFRGRVDARLAATRAASFGVACPVEGRRCTLTNIDWTIDARIISKRFGIGKVSLINDLVAMSHGLKRLRKTDLLTIQKGTGKAGNGAIIAAGTGLGEAMLFWDGSRRLSSPSEGGHADFAPRTPFEEELLKHLRRLHGHVSYERILSGSGLVSLYDFIRRKRGGRAKVFGKGIPVDELPHRIVEGALKGRDTACREAVSAFSSIYGAEAGNLALKALAVGGVYVGGGIALSVFADPAMRKTFVRAFSDKGRFSSFLKRVPVRLILNDRTALYGAALHALDMLG